VLVILPVGEFTPVVGNQFVPITYVSRTGEFDSAELDSFGITLDYAASAFGRSALRVSVTSEPPSGARLLMASSDVGLSQSFVPEPQSLDQIAQIEGIKNFVQFVRNTLNADARSRMIDSALNFLDQARVAELEDIRQPADEQEWDLALIDWMEESLLAID
jgi:hypothetical protein